MIGNRKQFNYTLFRSCQYKLALNFSNSDIEATIFRLGTNAFRVMMVLSILRTHEKQFIFSSQLNAINCDNIDFDSTLQMIDVFIKHAELISNNLNKSANIVIRKNKREKLVDSMPTVFNRGDIISKGKELKISIPTIDRILKELIALNKISKDGIEFCRVSRNIE